MLISNLIFSILCGVLFIVVANHRWLSQDIHQNFALTTLVVSIILTIGIGVNTWLYHKENE